jgi:hypothetical protein
MSIDFGDAEPEDAWHPDDPVDELLDNLARRLSLLGEMLEVRTRDRNELAAAIRDALTRVRRRRLTDREEVRVELAEADYAQVLARIVSGDVGSRHG